MRLELCDFVASPVSEAVLIVARFVPAALVAFWLMRTTVVEAPAVAVPTFLIVQLALTVVPETLTEPFCTWRSGAVTVNEPILTMSLSSVTEVCPDVL